MIRDGGGAGWRGLVCTRLLGHTGRHAAGDGRHIVAVWADPTSEAATTAGFDAAVAPAILQELDDEQETTP